MTETCGCAGRTARRRRRPRGPSSWVSPIRGKAVYLADETELVRLAVDGSGFDTVTGTGTTVLGTPAEPIVHDGEVFAAWLGQGTDGGTLWSSRDGPSSLDYGSGSMGDQRRPVFVASGRAVILNETRSGWAWTVPDGKLVASSQNWALDDQVDNNAVKSDEQLAVVIDPKPPVAEPDAFGVRAGSLVSLPVLMNDHDPNKDVLSIDPSSVTGLDPGFGTPSITDDGQRITVRVDAGSHGHGDAAVRGIGRHRRGRAPVEADHGHSDGRGRLRRHGTAMVRSAGLPRPLAEAGGRSRRHRHRSRAGGLGRSRGRPAGAAVGREHHADRQRRGVARRRCRLPAQRLRQGRRAAHRAHRDGRRHGPARSAPSRSSCT